ncbi:MAG: MGH1-like glycoside hydrolase domain-containing protein, partial [Anaerolineae bacterium]
EGNHGEDVKEYYFYLDNTPTHSYMKMLYKYPQNKFPYEKLIEENHKRSYLELEYELLDTGVFDKNEYFDIFIEYAKASEEDILIEINIHNRADHPSTCFVLPMLWFRNTWSWGYPAGPMNDVPTKPILHQIDAHCIEAKHPACGSYYLYAEETPEFIFTENETNSERLFNQPNASPYVKDAFHRYLIGKEKGAINPKKEGTKAAAVSSFTIPAKEKATMRLRLSKENNKQPFADFETVFRSRKKEAEEFYASIQPKDISDEEKMIQRQAFAGLLWSKQLYYYDVEHWVHDDPQTEKFRKRRMAMRNNGWEHLVNFDIISMPDKWEYPWYASWDLAFHCFALVYLDPDFAKRQLTLMTREWYMHPNGQLPAYEWNFFDVNPPVFAWAAFRVYQIDAKITGRFDRDFLKGIFHKLLLNFTWWINRKDAEGNNVFQGGFLGLDNISVFDRSKPLPTGGHIDQSDGTAWMAFYCVGMMKIALELAEEDPVYQDMATKFFEHFQRISKAMTNCGGQGHSLWDPIDKFFYDALHLPNGQIIPLKVRSLVGLLPLLAVEVLDPEIFKKAPIFERRLNWFTARHSTDECHMACVFTPGVSKRRQMAILTCQLLEGVLKYLSDENEFLSTYGIRSLSKYHKDHPYRFDVQGMSWEINYQPAESQSGLFGGNSNWRGPIWFPINFLLIEALYRHYAYYGDELKVEFPRGSGVQKSLKEIADDLSHRLIKIFLRNQEGKRPVFGGQEKFQNDPYWKDYLLFYEYFHGDNGAGIGASHQTGWTALVANLIQQSRGSKR